jgi:hypothetical protein
MFRKRNRPANYIIEIDGISVHVTRKKIRNLYVRVNRRSGEVRVSCPVHISEKGVERFIQTRLDWIKKHQKKAAKQPESIPLTYEDGEMHEYFGEKYLLRIKKRTERSRVELDGKELIMYCPDDASTEKKEKILESWYRKRLKEKIPELIAKYEPVMGVEVSEFGVKKMKTRWGTCNVRARRIWLNLILAKKSLGCLEMVVVHEMVHLKERLHNKRFYGFMDQYYPQWQTYEGELNSTVD